MDLKEKIKALKHNGFEEESIGDVFRIGKMTKNMDDFLGRSNVRISVFFNEMNDHYLFSVKVLNTESNLFCGRIHTEEFLIQVLQAIYVIPIQE